MVLCAYISIQTLPVSYIALSVMIGTVFIIPLLKLIYSKLGDLPLSKQSQMNYTQILMAVAGIIAILMIIMSYDTNKINAILLKIKVANNEHNVCKIIQCLQLIYEGYKIINILFAKEYNARN